MIPRLESAEDEVRSMISGSGTAWVDCFAGDSLADLLINIGKRGVFEVLHGLETTLEGGGRQASSVARLLLSLVGETKKEKAPFVDVLVSKRSSSPAGLKEST